MRSQRLAAHLWPILQRLGRTDEAVVPASMIEWHTYELDWQPSGVRFSVDGETLWQPSRRRRDPWAWSSGSTTNGWPCALPATFGMACWAASRRSGWRSPVSFWSDREVVDSVCDHEQEWPRNIPQLTTLQPAPGSRVVPVAWARPVRAVAGHREKVRRRTVVRRYGTVGRARSAIWQAGQGGHLGTGGRWRRWDQDFVANAQDVRLAHRFRIHGLQQNDADAELLRNAAPRIAGLHGIE